MSSVCRRAALLVAAWLVAVAAPGAQSPLRVCADPNNMPFSNQHGDGFENRIAVLVAQELHRPLVYFWLPQRRGFIRNSLNADPMRRRDRRAGAVPAAATDARYYRSSYAFVSRRDRHLRIDSFDAALLKTLTIGIQISGDDYNNPPAAQALASGTSSRTSADSRSTAITPDPIRSATSSMLWPMAVSTSPLSGVLSRVTTRAERGRRSR
jgi:mxaJ protein